MSLFDFVRDIGNALFHSDEEAAGKIKAYIEADNPGIDNLEVLYQKGFVTLRGTSRSWDAVEKAILMAGNVKGVGKAISEIQVVDAPTPPPAELQSAGGGAATPVDYYVIQQGDTLSALARRFYGDGGQYMKLFDANREVIKHPDSIFVGQKIRIPQP
ncbi:LysM domain-containing protein [Methylomagnum ishizawai]|uniref:LysM domain-containing protein n=1 Tax=Methylomagnum ishizawai TaxID=1760988 RepID=A0A1Y6CSM2_9GAMM|nr:BON domain-containing protein [Methylomagnum ishizawai]SMF93431.1 LysM domain-containing protein [Methylomagnum ishizawai]